MFSQAPFMFESFVASIALESLLLSVGYFVALQFTCWNKTVRALVAFVWLFSSMCSPHVPRHMVGCDPWKVTLWTFLRLFSRVLCCLIFPKVIEENPHWPHWWGFTPVCVIMCFLRWIVWVDEKLHCTHLCGFSTEWMSKCFFKSPVRPNDLLHCSQLFNLSREWVSKCCFKCPAWLNDLLHCAQLCNFSPVWIIMWPLRWPVRVNDLLHCTQLCNFSPVWIIMWVNETTLLVHSMIDLEKMCFRNMVSLLQRNPWLNAVANQLAAHRRRTGGALAAT